MAGLAETLVQRLLTGCINVSVHWPEPSNADARASHFDEHVAASFARDATETNDERRNNTVDAPESKVLEESVVSIAAELLVRTTGDLRDGSLAEGKLGTAIFFAEMCNCGFGQHYGEAALRELDRAIEWVGEEKVSLSLYGGVLGVATVHARLARDIVGEDVTTDYEWLDETVLRYLRRQWSGFNYDLINGLVGFGVYAILRYPLGGSADCLVEIVRALEDSAQTFETGRSWKTAVRCMPAWQQRRFPHGHFNIGVAHGVAGIVALLAQVVARDAGQSRARFLLDDSARWLAAQEGAGDTGMIFPNWIDSSGPVWGDRTGWCYGDMGVGMALWMAGRELGRPDLVASGMRALRSADDVRVTRGVLDAGLCHGAFGLAHVLSRIGKIENDAELQCASSRWIRNGLALRRADVPNYAGFAAYDPGASDGERWSARAGFLEGAAGAGLALLGALSDRHPWWDQLLLFPIEGRDPAEFRRPG